MCDHPEREASMLTVAPNVWCDRCLAPLVAALNGGGVATVASCCGHGKRPGNIALADGRQLFIADPVDAEAIHRFLHGRQHQGDGNE